MKEALFCISLLLLLSGCPLPTDSEATMLHIKSATLTLAWDPPVVNSHFPEYHTSRYRLYYSEHNANNWLMLDEIPATRNPEITISHSTLGDGVYDFAVSSVMSNGLESSFHTSLDWSANPASGWFVWWMRND